MQGGYRKCGAYRALINEGKFAKALRGRSGLCNVARSLSWSLCPTQGLNKQGCAAQRSDAIPV